MAYGDLDIPTMLADFGVACVFAGVTTQGILEDYDQRDQAVAQYVDADVKMRVVTIKTGSLPGILQESTLTVGGTSLKVRDIIKQSDGGLTQLYVVTP